MIDSPKEFTEQSEKEAYISGILRESKDCLSRYFPILYRDIPTKLNYEDNAEELKIYQDFSGDELTITIKTTENLSGKTLSEMSKADIPFLVFQNVAKGETISKKMQDLAFITHEYVHGINQALFNELRPDMVKLREDRNKELEAMNEADRNTSIREAGQKGENSLVSALGESLPVALEVLIMEKIMEDENMDEQTRINAAYFRNMHKKSLASQKLENDPRSKYTGLDEDMIVYRIYQELGEEGIMEFLRGFDFRNLSAIKKYSDTDKKILSREYKEILEMTGSEFVQRFTKRKFR